MDKKEAFEVMTNTWQHLQKSFTLSEIFWFWQARWCQMISQQSGASATHFKHSHLCAHVLAEYLDIIWATWEGIN